MSSDYPTRDLLVLSQLVYEHQPLAITALEMDPVAEAWEATVTTHLSRNQGLPATLTGEKAAALYLQLLAEYDIPLTSTTPDDPPLRSKQRKPSKVTYAEALANALYAKRLAEIEQEMDRTKEEFVAELKKLLE